MSSVLGRAPQCLLTAFLQRDRIMVKEHYGNSPTKPTPALATLEVHSHQCALMRRAQTRRRSHPRARPHRFLTANECQEIA